MRSRRMSIQKEDNDFFTNLKMKTSIFTKKMKQEEFVEIAKNDTFIHSPQIEHYYYLNSDSSYFKPIDFLRGESIEYSFRVEDQSSFP